MTETNQWKSTFLRFWSTQALSLLGSGLASFSLIWWITESTGSTTVLAAVSLATLLPGVLLGPLAGALVDQWDRKWVMLISDSVSALLALILAGLFWTNSVQLWHIILINILRSLAGVFQFPAVQSSTSLMVPKEQLTRVAGLNQALQGASLVATPPLGALLLTLLPIPVILGIDVLTAIVAIFLLASIRIPNPQNHQSLVQVSTTVWQDMRAGFRFIKQWSALVNIMGISALLNLFLVPAFTLVPILVTRHFLGSAFQLGWLNAAYGLGAISGGILLGVWGGFKRRIYTSLMGLVGLGIGSLLIGVSPRDAYWTGVAGMALLGIMNAFANGPFFAILQSVIPPEIQGRVFTVLISVSTAATPIGLALAGPLADQFSVQTWYLLSAIACGGIVTWIAFNPEMLQVEEKRALLNTVKGTIAD